MTKKPTRKKKAPVRKKAKTQDAKAKAGQTSALRKLTPIAKEINIRLEKAEGLTDKAYDHRLAAALQLEEARKQCKAAKINFKTWVNENVDQSYETVRKLVAVGAADDPKQALEDLRAGAKKRVAEHRERKKAKAEKDAKTLKQVETPAGRILSGFKAVKDEEGANLIKSQASKYGLRVVSEEEAEVAKKSKARKGSIVDEMKSLYGMASAKERKEIAAWIAKMQKQSKETEDGDYGDIPEALKKKPKRVVRRKKAA